MSVHTDLLMKLEPISALSPGRIQELASMCIIERVSQGLNPFRMNVVQNEQLLYLLAGQLKLAYGDGHNEVLEGGSDTARHPVAANQAEVQDVAALSEIQVLRIDADLLDIMLTWDQLASYERITPAPYSTERSTGDWMRATDVFSAESLKNGIFRTLPPANVEEMFKRMQRVPVQPGQAILHQGQEGDYYYLIEEGVAEVSRETPETGKVRLAELGSGQAFGEEALVSGNKRNATVTMQTAGMLLRLAKKDFDELLKTPLLQQVSKEEAVLKVQAGTRLVDVRTPVEYNLKHFPGAINIPLPDIREAMNTLNKEKEYLVYCQTGRRANAATFILAQQGFKVMAISA
jgi:rhodanese-related sulfurtransferase